MNTMNWTSLYKNYAGKWVAINSGDQKTVVASATTAKAVVKKAKTLGFATAPIMKIPKEVIAFAGNEVSV